MPDKSTLRIRNASLLAGSLDSSRDLREVAMDAKAHLPIAPNLFIVGAPKCGTTSLYEYLRCHPQIYFPHDEDDYARVKEPNHLCPELRIADKDAIRDRGAYMALYQGGQNALWRGDASTNYLFSENAASNIKSLSPDARILIMLRPPVEWMHSYHSELVRHHHEDILDFDEAVAACTDRRNGCRIPPKSGVPMCLDYLAMADFAPQIERYHHAFGRDAVKVILLEDLAGSPEATFRDVLAFLGVNTSFRPEFLVHNETPRRGRVEEVLRVLYRNPAIKVVAQRSVSRAIRHRLLATARQLDTRRRFPDPVDERLHEQSARGIERLAALIDRDLRHWQTSTQRRRARVI
ncbi:MAG: sulfotransferase [Betaproteobacteria bacterium]|jgi:hypothetical protein|nr:sulfotransferase [Betaproteobacteria bacterium]